MGKTRAGLCSAAIAALLVVGGLGPVAASSPQPKPKKARSSKATAVVAIIDTGINPYHVTFRDDSKLARKHPSTYIEGFPKSAKALRLSLDAPDYRTAVQRDCDRVWSKVETGKLYWFPGTKIIGGITFEDASTIPCSARILDPSGHGTMTASRATSVEYGACEECRVVAVQGFTTESVDWAAKNASWIDLQSNSWGRFLPGWLPTDPTGFAVNDPAFVRSVESAARKHLSFWASGNGTLTRFGVVGHPTIIDPRMTPSIIMVGGHDSGYVNTWPDFPPHVVSDSCNSWAAYHNHMKDSADDVGSGTSGASPYAAGGAARILLEARRILGDTTTGVTGKVVARGPSGLVSKGPLEDGELTLEEWRTLVLKTASPRPERHHDDGSVCDTVSGLVLYSSTPVLWEDVPEEYPEYFHIGYGAVDEDAEKRAFKVLTGKAELPDRTRTDDYFALDVQVRQALYDVFSTGALRAP